MNTIKSFFWAFVFIFIGLQAAHGQGIVGDWYTVDDNTGETKGVVQFFERDGKVHGKVLTILHPDPIKQKETCYRCSDYRKDQLVLGMVIIRDLEAEDDGYFGGGKVLDPEKGREYSCYAKLLSKDKLKLRGYLGIPLIGRTQYWFRKTEEL